MHQQWSFVTLALSHRYHQKIIAHFIAVHRWQRCQDTTVVHVDMQCGSLCASPIKGHGIHSQTLHELTIQNSVQICGALTWKVMFQSGHNFTDTSWAVMICANLQTDWDNKVKTRFKKWGIQLWATTHFKNGFQFQKGYAASYLHKTSQKTGKCSLRMKYDWFVWGLLNNSYL